MMEEGTKKKEIKKEVGRKTDTDRGLRRARE